MGPTTTNQKEAGVICVILISARADIRRDKEKHYVIIKGSILQEDIQSLICMHLIVCEANTYRTSINK